MTQIFRAYWDKTSSLTGVPTGSDPNADGASGTSSTTSGITRKADRKRGSVLSGEGSIDFADVANQYLTASGFSEDDVFVDMLVLFDTFQSLNSEQQLLAIHDSAGALQGNLVLKVVSTSPLEGRFIIRNAGTNITTDTTVIVPRTLYRIGIRQTKGSGTGIIRGYCVEANAAIIAHFGGSTTQTLTTQAAEVRFGATNGIEFDGRVDVVRVFDAFDATAQTPYKRLRYVNADYGVDSTSRDGSVDDSAHAWRTMGHAFPRLRPGDTLHVSSGSYPGWHISSSSCSQALKGNPITVIGSDDYTSWIRGAASTCRITNAHSWFFEYINIDGAEYYVVPGPTNQVDDDLLIIRGNDWTWTKSEIRNSPRYLFYSEKTDLVDKYNYFSTFKALFAVGINGDVDDDLTGIEDRSAGWTISHCWVHNNEGINAGPVQFSQPPDTFHGDGINQDHCLYITEGSDGTISHCLLTDTPNGRAVKVGMSKDEGDILPRNLTMEYCTFVYNWGESLSKVSYGASDNRYDYCVMVGPTRLGSNATVAVGPRVPNHPAVDYFPEGSSSFDGMGNVVENCHVWIVSRAVDPVVAPATGELDEGPAGNTHADPGLNNRYEPTNLTMTNPLDPDEQLFTHGHLHGCSSYLQWDGPKQVFRRTALFRRVRR